MIYSRKIILLCLILTQMVLYGQKWHTIPKQNLPLYQINAISETSKHNRLFNVEGFDISSQITFGLYKIYLSDIKKDSGFDFYLSQLPDSSITDAKRYKDYLNNPVYDTCAVAGISWEAAMNFCKWMMLKKSASDSDFYIYSLPKVSQWLSAKYFLDSNKIMNDFSKNFSDWTSCLFYEGAFGFTGFSYDVEFYAKNNDAPRNKRKIIIGNNFLFMPNYEVTRQGAYYQNKGYKYVSFRVIREKLNSQNPSHLSLLNYLNIQ